MGGRVEAIQLLASGILGSGYILHGRLFACSKWTLTSGMANGVQTTLMFVR